MAYNASTSAMSPDNTTGTATLVSDVGRVVILTVFSVLSTIGIIANALMIAILVRMKRKPFHIIITGLSLSDFISACNSPFYAIVNYSFRNYTLPAMFCFSTPTFDIVTSIITVYHVLLLTIIRFRGVYNAVAHRGEMTNKKCYVLVVALWVWSLILAAPYPFSFMILKTSNGFACDIRHKPIVQLLTLLSTTIGVFIPMLVIVGFCVAIAFYFIRKKSSANSKTTNPAMKQKEKQALRQLVAIVVSFFIGYTVEYGIKLYIIIDRASLTDHQALTLSFISHGVLRTTECLNPFLYYYASGDIREAVKRLVARTRPSTSSHLNKTDPACPQNQSNMTMAPSSV